MHRLRTFGLACLLVIVVVSAFGVGAFSQSLARLTPENAAQIIEVEQITVPGMAAVMDTTLHPDGTLLAVADANGVAWVIDTRTQQPLFILEELGVGSVDFHPDGSRLLMGAADGSVRVWGVPGSGEPPAPITEAAPALLNLNTATQAGLETLPGIGPVLAARIIEYRTLNGPFADVAQLQNVDGIGAGILEDVRPLVTVE